MLKIRHLRPSDYRVQPWRNHRGTTEEIAIFPEGSTHQEDSFEWRVSSALIASSCSFSQFLGYDRTIVCLEGDGIALNHDCVDTPQTLKRLVPYHFKGEWQTTCEISDKSVRDFNLMVRRGKVAAELEVLRIGSVILEQEIRTADTLLFCVTGQLTAAAPGFEQKLSPFETLMIRKENSASVTLKIRASTGSCEAILIRIRQLALT
jgi:environmental stress-induced protein Ves